LAGLLSMRLELLSLLGLLLVLLLWLLAPPLLLLPPGLLLAGLLLWLRPGDEVFWLCACEFKVEQVAVLGRKRQGAAPIERHPAEMSKLKSQNDR